MGQELRRARKAANYTQRALGDLLGVTGSAVGQWETGATHPLWTQQQRLREILLPAEPPTLLDGDDQLVTQRELKALRDELQTLAASHRRLQAKVALVLGVAASKSVSQSERPAQQSPGGTS